MYDLNTIHCYGQPISRKDNQRIQLPIQLSKLTRTLPTVFSHHLINIGKPIKLKLPKHFLHSYSLLFIYFTVPRLTSFSKIVPTPIQRFPFFVFKIRRLNSIFIHFHEHKGCISETKDKQFCKRV